MAFRSLVLTALVAGSAAHAQDDPAKALAEALSAFGQVPAPQCNSDLLSVSGWEIEPERADRNNSFRRIAISLTSAATAPIDMVQGSVTFTDPLGRDVGRFPIDQDLTVSPGAVAVSVAYVSSSQDRRLIALPPERLTAKACVRSVLFADGTIQRFDGAD